MSCSPASLLSASLRDDINLANTITKDNYICIVLKRFKGDKVLPGSYSMLSDVMIKVVIADRPL